MKKIMYNNNFIKIINVKIYYHLNKKLFIFYIFNKKFKNY